MPLVPENQSHMLFADAKLPDSIALIAGKYGEQAPPIVRAASNLPRCNSPPELFCRPYHPLTEFSKIPAIDCWSLIIVTRHHLRTLPTFRKLPGSIPAESQLSLLRQKVAILALPIFQLLGGTHISGRTVYAQ